ncbi:unnamed protein product [Linum trigynum]|uniref:Uncharacterized protein n=1 Tax=Linum trigynum TaxID=586398 RepID=A0AAV2EAI5_9ROSI
MIFRDEIVLCSKTVDGSRRRQLKLKFLRCRLGLHIRRTKQKIPISRTKPIIAPATVMLVTSRFFRLKCPPVGIREGATGNLVGGAKEAAERLR